MIAINPKFYGVDWFLEEGWEGCGEDVVSGWWHVRFAHYGVEFLVGLGSQWGYERWSSDAPIADEDVGR